MTKPKDSTLINVCIIPSEEVAANCVKSSQSLEDENTLIVLGGDKFAHMTAFMARFPDSAVARVVSSVEQVLQEIESFRLEHAGFFMTEGRYFEVSYHRSPSLMDLHESLIANLAAMRINPGNPYEEGYFTPYTSEQQKNAEQTGYDLARELYRPHITLTRYREGGVPATMPTLPEVDMSFELDKVCVYKADDNGAVYELIKEFRV